MVFKQRDVKKDRKPKQIVELASTRAQEFDFCLKYCVIENACDFKR